MSTEFYSGMKGPVAISKLNALWDLASNVQVAPGTVVYRGTWDASSGSYPSSATLGDYYKINVSGTIATISYSVNDSIIYNGTSWD